MGAQDGNRSKMLPKLADIADAIASGHTTLAEVAAAHGIATHTLQSRMSYAGWGADGLPNTGTKPIVLLPLVGDESLDWQDDAECGEGGADWFAEDTAGISEAKAICAHCNVRAQCLDWTLRIEDGKSLVHRYGVYGAMSRSERARLADEGAA